MKKYLNLTQIIGFLLLFNNSFGQNTIDDTIETLNELNNVQVYADQNLISDWAGVRKDIKLRDFSFSFDKSSISAKKYDVDLIISEAKVTLFRYNKFTAFTIWQPGGTEPMNVFYSMARPGDRYELQVSLVAKNKLGEKVPLKSKFIYNLPLY
ncbi:hypothetical protein [Spirosoma panaciterrae]|uniref:hypothetical protein n=1 Tax=Spirosoma panaciterrae TaxID=496058 RepID=UPI00036F81D4|nr:hypothetical protein [Spirosoma panaciterrae]